MSALPAKLVANAKLTVSLEVVGTRSDGYHLIDAEMVTLDLHDTVELSAGRGVTVIGSSGLEVPSGDDNLVARALAAVGIEAHAILNKQIPAGAGLGGGSADAAAILSWAGVVDPSAAVELGADVAFCLAGGRARVSGIGEIVEALEFVPRTYSLLTPPLGVRTPDVYGAWDALGGPSGSFGNDLEPAALAAVPELLWWREAFQEMAGVRPRLAGSGGTWFVAGEVVGTVDGVSTVVTHTTPARLNS